jgi:uncharacterized MAPEG superfamily protein
MTLSFWCVLIAGLLPYAGTAAAKWGFKNFDNNQPREWLAKQTGIRARGNAAQHNSFEAFPFFAAAVIIASLVKAPQAALDAWAIGFIAARIGFLICYLADKANLRSLFWFAGMICVVAIFGLAALRA